MQKYNLLLLLVFSGRSVQNRCLHLGIFVSGLGIPSDWEWERMCVSVHVCTEADLERERELLLSGSRLMHNSA